MESEDYIFISYSRKDLPAVKSIAKKMRKSGYNIRYDNDIYPGERWGDNIASSIANCTVFVEFLSKTSLNSPYCQMETHHAIMLDKTVIPVYLEESVTLPDNETHRALRHFQSVRYTNPAELLEELKKNPEVERCHSDAPQKRNYVKLIAAAFEKGKKQLHSGWNSFLNVLFLLEAIGLIVLVYKVWTVEWPPHSDEILWYWDENGILDINAFRLKMDDYNYSLDSDFFPPPWANKTQLIQLAVIHEGVTHIGASSFQNCSNMKFVLISKGVTSIGSEAFSGCTSLKQIQFSGGIQIIGKGAFTYCVALEEITIPNSIRTIESNAFSGCSNLKTVHIQFDLERVQIVEAIPDSSSADADTLYISATTFDPGTKIIFEPSDADANIVEYIWGSDYEGGLFYEH